MIEIKIRQGQPHTFIVWLPSAPTNIPSLTVRRPSGNFTAALTQVSQTVTVDSVGTDRRTLTVDAAVAPATDPQLGGERGGAAVLLLDGHGAIPVIVADCLSSTSILLADPLPVGTAGKAGILEWSTWYTAFTAADVSSTLGSYPFTVTWTARDGGGPDMPAEYEYLEGLIYCVRMPFHTGLTARGLRTWATSFSAQIPTGQNSWQPQIDAAQRMLIRWIRRDLQPRGVTEDAVNGAAFEEVHAMLVVALILGSQAAGGADRLEARDAFMQEAKDLYASIMASIPWLDADGDGVVDSGETAVATGPRASWVGGSFTSGAPDGLPIFTRNMKH